ncbi:hypothetical protein K7X08_006832 [Anisodus acutangulus]|uniref:Secreted protein n=1 Tax=Anisodus acutangulus TaxID=402998 RepID=A0A9Q1QZC0_9SOLA|nr:hypothetical protein K7X08_006832 [Anisodus acutangulus]
MGCVLPFWARLLISLISFSHQYATTQEEKALNSGISIRLKKKEVTKKSSCLDNGAGISGRKPKDEPQTLKVHEVV